MTPPEKQTVQPEDGRKEEEGRCQAILDALPFYALLIDADHKILAANTAVLEELDKPPDLICGEYCPQAIHGCDQPYHGCPLEQAAAENKAVELEMYDDDHDMWCMSSVYPTRLKDDQGRPLYLHFTRDITSVKAAQVALSQSLEHHKAIGELLNRLQSCRRPSEVLEELVDLTLSLSWMDVSNGACAFLVEQDRLRMVVQRNMAEAARKSCRMVGMGDCVCGAVAMSGKVAILSPEEIEGRFGHPTPVEHGHAVLPLVSDGATLGVLNFYLEPDQLPSPSQVAYLKAAAGIATTALAEQLARQEARQAREAKLQLERRLLGRVLSSQEDERKRISRELHDELGQVLSALLLEIKAEDLGSDPAFLRFQKRMQNSIRGVIGKVSAIAWDLRPSILDDYGLSSAITRYVQRLADLADLDIDYQYVCPPELDTRLSPEVEIALYRITQESLHNVVRHARATRVSVLLVRQPEEVTVLVEDDGIGFDPLAVDESGDDSSLGLLGIRERASLLNGTVQIESAPKKGTAVKVTLPLPAPGVEPPRAIDQRG